MRDVQCIDVNSKLKLKIIGIQKRSHMIYPNLFLSHVQRQESNCGQFQVPAKETCSFLQDITCKLKL